MQSCGKIAKGWLKELAVERKKRMREKEKERGGERFRALESFLRANTDLSTRRHSWKRNLIREKLNSFKCTSRSLFAPYLPSPTYTTASFFISYPLLLSFGVFNPLSILLVPPPLSTLAPFSYPLILSQPFSLRKRRSAIHHSSSFLFFLLLSFNSPPSPPPLSSFFPFPFFNASFKDVSLPCLHSLFSLFFFTSEKLLSSSFFSISLFLIEYCALFLEEQLLNFRLFNPLN